MGLAARLPPCPGQSRVPPDLDSSDSSLHSDNEDSILGLLVVLPPCSMRRLPRPLVRGVVSSCPRRSSTSPVSAWYPQIRSLWLSLSQALVPAIMLPLTHDTLVGPVGLFPLQLVEPSPLVQFESCSVFLLPKRIIVLHAVPMGVQQVFLPIQECRICFGLVGRAVRACVSPVSSPLVHVSHILSLHPLPALGARHLLLGVSSFSGHPAGLGLGWLSCWQFVRLARLN